MARTFSGDMPKLSIGAAGASTELASPSPAALSALTFDGGVTLDTPQNRITMATSAIGISHFTFERRRARGSAEDGERGGGLKPAGAAAFRAGAGAPGRRP